MQGACNGRGTVGGGCDGSGSGGGVSVEEDSYKALTRLIVDALEDGQHRQAVLFEASIPAEQQAVALLDVLLKICVKDSTAQCVLLCSRRQLHSAAFGQRARCLTASSCLGQQQAQIAEDALRRVHIKYVQQAPASGGLPELVELLSALQNLAFAPAAIAVLGLSQLVCSPQSQQQHQQHQQQPVGTGGCVGGSGSIMGGTPATGVVTGSTTPTMGTVVTASSCLPLGFSRSTMMGAAAVDAQYRALAAALLVDAAAQAEARHRAAGAQGCCCALLWETTSCGSSCGSVTSGGFAQESSMLGCAFDTVWAAQVDGTLSSALTARPLFAVPSSAPGRLACQ